MKTYHLYLFTSDRKRGRLVASFARYKDLVAEAQRRTIAAGYPKSRWFDLFDWNQS